MVRVSMLIASIIKTVSLTVYCLLFLGEGGSILAHFNQTQANIARDNIQASTIVTHVPTYTENLIIDAERAILEQDPTHQDGI